MSFTLDTNCLIDVDEGRPAAPHVRQLLAAAAEGKADVAMAASSASEKQQDGGFLQNIGLFKQRMQDLGFGGLDLLPSIARYGIGFWGVGLYGAPNEASGLRERLIYATMFPDSPYAWADYAAAAGADPGNHATRDYFKWRNRILDAQAYWAHDHAARDIFVTSDAAFRKLEGLAAFPKARCLSPEEAAALI